MANQSQSLIFVDHDRPDPGVPSIGQPPCLVVRVSCPN